MTSLTLNRLGRRHSTEMIAAVAGGKPLPEAILAQIWARTGGVPLFVEELTKTVLESGLLKDAGDRYELTGPLPPLAIPSTLQDSLMARLDRFAPVKEVAQIGAVIGREFSYELLAALSPLDETALQEALSQLIGSELAFRRGTIPNAIYSFKHAFVQEAAYRSLLKSKRQQLHANVAAALRERLAETIESQPEILAHHLTEAGLTAEAMGCWRHAGQLAAERSANAEATAHLHRGLELLRALPESSERNEQELDLLTTLGSLLMSTKGHGHAEVATVYRRARDLCRSGGDTSRLAAVLQGLRLHHMYRAELALARKAAEELLALGEETGESGYLVEGERAVGVVRFFAGEFQAAGDHLERGITLYDIQAHGRHALRYVEDPGETCLTYLARALWVLGYPDQAVARSEQAIAVAQTVAHAASITEAMVWRADIALHCREVLDARERAAAALALAIEHGMPMRTGMASMMHGLALSEQGQSADGVAQIREGLSVLGGPVTSCTVPILSRGWPRRSARPDKSRRGCPRSTRRSTAPASPERPIGMRSCSGARASCFSPPMARTQPPPKPVSAGRSKSPRPRAPNPWSSEPRSASPGYWQSRASAGRPTTCSRPFMAGSPRASTPLI
jgi:predicted ATPase